MSKITQENKAKKTKNSESDENQNSSVPNYGKCCSCRFYGKPCRKSNEYVPRKKPACGDYKCRA